MKKLSPKNWMGPNPNGPLSCDRAIRYPGLVRETWVLLEISWKLYWFVGLCVFYWPKATAIITQMPAQELWTRDRFATLLPINSRLVAIFGSFHMHWLLNWSWWYPHPIFFLLDLWTPGEHPSNRHTCMRSSQHWKKCYPVEVPTTHRCQACLWHAAILRSSR